MAATDNHETRERWVKETIRSDLRYFPRIGEELDFDSNDAKTVIATLVAATEGLDREHEVQPYVSSLLNAIPSLRFAMLPHQMSWLDFLHTFRTRVPENGINYPFQVTDFTYAVEPDPRGGVLDERETSKLEQPARAKIHDFLRRTGDQTTARKAVEAGMGLIGTHLVETIAKTPSGRKLDDALKAFIYGIANRIPSLVYFMVKQPTEDNLSDWYGFLRDNVDTMLARQLHKGRVFQFPTIKFLREIDFDIFPTEKDPKFGGMTCTARYCNNTATSVCGDCRTQVYCSQPCQFIDWRTHQHECSKD